MNTPPQINALIEEWFKKLGFKEDLLSNLEGEWRIPNRPLGEISNFVTEKMSKLNDPTIDHEALGPLFDVLSEVDYQYTLFDQDPDAYIEQLWDGVDLACLDLIYLLNFLRRVTGEHTTWSTTASIGDIEWLYPWFDGIQIPKSLELMVHKLARHLDRIPHLSYEDLVLTNPLKHDPRLFFDGKTGNSEYLFYLWHELIERVFDEIIVWLEQLLEGESDAPSVDDLKVSWAAAQRLLRKFFSLDDEQFAIFRTFYFGNEILDYRWPSGAFSSSMPIIDLLIGLNTLETANHGYLDENLKHYPRAWQLAIKRAIQKYQSGDTVLTYALSRRDDELLTLYNEMGASILRFRQMHLWLVKKKIPEVFAWNETGTGGFNVDEFLRKNIEYTRASLNK